MVDIAGHRTLNDLIDEKAKSVGDLPAATVESASGEVVTRTYSQLREEVLRVAGGFERLGVRRGDRVLVHLPNSLELLLSWFGLARLGAVMVPSNPALTIREVAHFACAAAVSAAVVRSEHLGTVREATALPGDRVVVCGGDTSGCTDWADLAGSHPPVVLPHVEADDVVEIIFTSGTTAAPKGVLITHANCLRSGEQVAKSLYLGPDDRALSALPAFHVNAQSSTVLPCMTVGAHFVLLEQYRATTYIAQMRRHRATVTSLVGTQVRTLLRQPPTPQDADHRVSRVFYAINVTDGEFAEFERRFGMRLLNGYGLSEAMTAVTIAPLHGERRWPSVGLPLLDREVRIVGEGGHPVPAGVVGEITVKGVPGRSIMLGYHEDPVATAHAIREGWLHTGDSGFIDEHGYIHFVDRKKDMIKRSGENVSATEIESVLLEHPDVHEAAVVGVPDDVRDEGIKAFIVPSPGSSPDVEDVLEHCRLHLAAFKVPTEVVVVPSLPKTSIGKIAKKLLRNPAVVTS